MSIPVVPVIMTTPEIRTRTACRAKVTRVKNHITAILQNESEYSAQELIVELEDNLSELDKRIQELDEADTACLDLIETEEEIESTVEECSNLRRLARQVRSKVILKLKILNSSEGDNHNDSVSGTSSSSRPNVKLPKLSLPKLNGDILQWRPFWDRFYAAVHD